MFSVVILLAVSTSPILNGDPVEKAWKILNEALTNKAADKRAEGVQALGSIKTSSKATGFAEKALSDPEAVVRAAAATSLGEMKAEAARPKLRAALQDKNLKVVLAATNALYTLHDPAAYEIYYAILTGKQKSSQSLMQTQLETLKDRKQMEQLALETGIGFVPFGGMGWQAWKTLTRDDSSPIKATAAERIASDPDPKSAEALRVASLDKRWRVRAAAANAMGLRGDPKMIPEVAPMLLDGSESVRLEAAAAVVTLAGKQRR